FGPLGQRHDEKIVTPDVADEILRRSAAAHDVDSSRSDELNRFVAVRKAVHVVERLEVVEIQVEYREGLVGIEPAPQLRFDGQIPRQPRERGERRVNFDAANFRLYPR